MSLPNVWHLRTVAEASAKPCFICYKASPSVLITPDNKVDKHRSYLHQRDLIEFRTTSIYVEGI